MNEAKEAMQRLIYSRRCLMRWVQQTKFVYSDRRPRVLAIEYMHGTRKKSKAKQISSTFPPTLTLQSPACPVVMFGSEVLSVLEVNDIVLSLTIMSVATLPGIELLSLARYRLWTRWMGCWKQILCHRYSSFGIALVI